MKTIDEEETIEQELWQILAEARKLSLHGEPLRAEWLYEEALDMTESVFGVRSSQCAHVLFCTAAFYSDQHKPKSAQYNWQKMREIMRF